MKLTLKKKNNPRIKIIGIDNGLALDNLEEDINNRNFYCYDSKCKVLHTYKNKHNTYTAILELTSELYSHIHNRDFFIYVGHKYCKCFTDFNISPCKKYGSFTHSYKKCLNTEVCISCGGKHSLENCKSDIIRCANCLFLNSKYNNKTRLDINHSITDSNKCNCLKNIIKLVVDNTNFPYDPVIPNFLNGITGS